MSFVIKLYLEQTLRARKFVIKFYGITQQLGAIFNG